MRGLKLLLLLLQIIRQCRTSCRCVDWNLAERVPLSKVSVAPHVGAWIETLRSCESVCQIVGRTSCRCVDWNNFAAVTRVAAFCRTSCRCVDWNHQLFIILILTLRRTSCRCVDWNYIIVRTINCIEGRTSCRCVDWNLTLIRGSAPPLIRRTSCRCVDWNTRSQQV